MKFEDVGKSYRTPGKHAALNSFLGKCAGVATTDKFRRLTNGGTFHVIDCTAGDGQSNDFSKFTSPGIVCKHVDFLRDRLFPCKAEFYERSQASAAMLKTVVTQWPVINEDAANLMPTWAENDVLFISNDPNTIADWALPSALKSAPKFTTVFSTLGCNVGGLKRMKREDRMQWYVHVEDQLALLQTWHDALLITLEGDSSQWAYLVNCPTADGWPQDLEKSFTKAFEDTGHALRMAWFKNDPIGFKDLQDDLFLTKKERSAEKQTELETA